MVMTEKQRLYQQEYRKRNKDRIKERDHKKTIERKRKWRIDNREKYLTWCRNYAEKIREKERERSKKYRKKNRDEINARKRELYREENSSRRKWQEENRDKVREHGRGYYERNKEKFSAQGKLGYAVKKGRIVRPDRCQFCNKESKPEGHHADYDKPLEVIWLCRMCHAAVHMKLREQDVNLVQQ